VAFVDAKSVDQVIFYDGIVAPEEYSVVSGIPHDVIFYNGIVLVGEDPDASPVRVLARSGEDRRVFYGVAPDDGAGIAVPQIKPVVKTVFHLAVFNYQLQHAQGYQPVFTGVFNVYLVKGDVGATGDVYRVFIGAFEVQVFHAQVTGLVGLGQQVVQRCCLNFRCRGVCIAQEHVHFLGGGVIIPFSGLVQRLDVVFDEESIADFGFIGAAACKGKGVSTVRGDLLCINDPLFLLDDHLSPVPVG